jgi:uncharacterized protein (TIGR02145 family)
MAACPSGWHLPTQNEWNVLTLAVGDVSTAGKHLKATSGWNEDGNEDTHGFSALPGGFGSSGGSEVGAACSWWSSSENGYCAYDRSMRLNNEDVGSYCSDKDFLTGVRCVKDDD